MSIKIENNYYFHRTDDGIGAWYSSQFVTSSLLGTLNPSYPGTYYDFAFKASKSGVSFRDNNNSSNSLTPKTDTLACNTKSVKVKYIWLNDTLGLNKYEWAWANKKSNEQFPEITFEGSGNYNLALKITFSDGKTESFKQTLTIPDCASNISNIDTSKVYKSNDFLIFPNPTNNFITVELKESTNYICTIIDTYGKKIKDIKINGKSIEIDCKDLSSGLYFIKVENQNTNYISKFIKQ